MDNFQVFCIAVITATFSLILYDYFLKKSCCGFESCQCIPEFYSDHIQNGTHNMEKLGITAKALYLANLKGDCTHNKYGSIEVGIDYKLMINAFKLTKNELSIIEGIIMANGHTYYEF